MPSGSRRRSEHRLRTRLLRLASLIPSLRWRVRHARGDAPRSKEPPQGRRSPDDLERSEERPSADARASASRAARDLDADERRLVALLCCAVAGGKAQELIACLEPQIRDRLSPAAAALAPASARERLLAWARSLVTPRDAAAHARIRRALGAERAPIRALADQVFGPDPSQVTEPHAPDEGGGRRPRRGAPHPALLAYVRRVGLRALVDAADGCPAS